MRKWRFKGMSYSIVYNKQFLKIDEKIIPLVLCGDSNCYESLPNGRKRRERQWYSLYFNSTNEPIAATEKEIMKRVKSHCGGEQYQEHFVQNGKWIDDKGLIRFFQNGIKNAKTIEELKNDYFFRGMQGYFSVWKEMENIIEDVVNIYSSEDLRKFLNAAQDRLIKRAENEGIYICLHYYNEKFEPRVKSERKRSERLTDYFVIKIRNYDSYLVKLTSRRMKYSPLCNLAKQQNSLKQKKRLIDI